MNTTQKIRDVVIFKMEVGHFTKYLVGHLKLVLLKNLKYQTTQHFANSQISKAKLYITKSKVFGKK